MEDVLAREELMGRILFVTSAIYYLGISPPPSVEYLFPDQETDERANVLRIYNSIRGIVIVGIATDFVAMFLSLITTIYKYRVGVFGLWGVLKYYAAMSLVAAAYALYIYIHQNIIIALTGRTVRVQGYTRGPLVYAIITTGLASLWGFPKAVRAVERIRLAR